MHISNHELHEEMYCSQQICIPPTFPYLLRQFAKAAIRTQPNDLLKWSTAYFRCLSLNIPPPVKPRLEYPIPKDYYGMTPGWLKALLHQMPGITHISFKTLWDRWIGACLHHPDLIKILCLGGFTDPMAIPWLRFIALCAAFLTESLTKSMIMICEVLTEEPEGGSAMIDVEVFNDLYQFLARIDASQAQMLKNYYFRDSLLGLWDRRIKEDQGPFELPEQEEEEESVVSTPEEEEAEEERVKDDGSIISCPSVEGADDVEGLREEIERRMREDGEYEGDGDDLSADTLKSDEKLSGMMPSQHSEIEADAEDAHKAQEDDAHDDDEDSKKSGEDDDEGDTKEDGSIKLKGSQEKVEEAEAAEEEEGSQEAPDVEDGHGEDMARLRAVQEELHGEDDYDLEKLKADLLLEQALPKTESQIIAPDHYRTKSYCEKEKAGAAAPGQPAVAEGAEEARTMTDEELKKAIEDKIKEGEYEEVYVEAVPGIGPVIPEHMIHDVVEYMKTMAREQHHVVMPRNIRHYECPPLEILDY